MSGASVTLITASCWWTEGVRGWWVFGKFASLLLKSLQMDECFIKPCLEKNSIISAKHLTLAPGSCTSRDPSLYNFRLERMEAGKVFHNQFTLRDDYKPFPSLPHEPLPSLHLSLSTFLSRVPSRSLSFSLLHSHLSSCQ